MLPTFLHFIKPYFEVINYLSISDVLQNLPGSGFSACEAGIDEPVTIKVETITAMKCFPPMCIRLLNGGSRPILKGQLMDGSNRRAPVV